MKKFFGLVVLMTLLFVTNSTAQRKWMLAEESAKEIKVGESNLYALRSGFNERVSKSTLLNSGTKEKDFLDNSCDSTCLFYFVAVGEREDNGEVYKTYVLKSFGNKKYLSDGQQRYVSSPSEAFQFTARPVKEYQNDAEIGEEWTNYSHAVNYLSAGAEAAHTWVFCHPYQREYIAFGNNPTFTFYCSSNNWFLLEATEVELTAFEKLSMVFENYYQKPVDKETYTVGENPGCINQDLFDFMLATYTEAVQITQDGNLPDSEYERMRLQILESFSRYEKERVPLIDGYYFMRNELSNHDVYEKSMGLYRGGFDSWNVERAKSVWQVIMTEKNDGSFYLKNWETENYFAKAPSAASHWTTVGEPNSSFTATLNNGNFYIVRDESGSVVYNSKKAGDNRIINWSDGAEINPASHFQFIKVSADSMAEIASAVQQNILNKRLASLVSQAKYEINTTRNLAGLTFDGNYGSAGLVKEFEKTNADMNDPKFAFDGNVNTFYYTQWVSSAGPQDFHWVQVDLGKELQDIYVKFSWRHDNKDFNPTRIAFISNEDLTATQWTDTLYHDTVVYEYATPYAKGVQEATTYIGKIHLKKAAQHIRMAVTRTRKNTIIGGGPRWQIGELRFYDAAECVDNPSFSLVPAEVIAEFDAAVAAAEVEIANHLATKETYDRVETAYDAFWAAYPDPTDLKNQMEKAFELQELASEDKDALGYYQVGAKADFLKKLEEINTFINSKAALNLDEIADCEKQVDEAVKAFDAKIIAPEAGCVYRLVSTAGYDYPADGGDPVEKKCNDALICSGNADVNNAVKWNYKSYECDDRFNALWLVEKNEVGAYSFKNLANGLYMKNPFEGLTPEEYKDVDGVVRFSETPNYFTLSASVNPGSFVIELMKGHYLHYLAGNVIDHYNVRTSAWNTISFVKVDDNNFSSTYKIDVKENAVQILTMPIDLGGVYVGDTGTALKVSGVKDGFIHLVPFEDGVIPAGTPFLVSTGEEEFIIDSDLMNDASIEDNLNLNYVRTPMEMNGLVSAPQRTEIGAGYGYLLNGNVLISTEGLVIPAGSGYFNNGIPNTEEEGEVLLKLTGEILGEGITSVDQLEIIKNDNKDVYTISGVKVRGGVKMGAATKNLPKGVYIVGGKKVIVK